MWTRLVTGLGVAASLVLAAGCGTSALPAGASSSAATTPPAGFASASPAGLPQLTLRPATGPVGTHVTISGQLDPEQVRADGPGFRHPAFFSLVTEVQDDCARALHGSDCSAGPGGLAGCELIVGLTRPLVSLDTATGRVNGSFTVGGEGTCFQERPTGRPQATLPGRYDLAVGCHACFFAPFKVTGSLVHVASCPVPASDYAGTPYSPQPAPAMTSLPASVTPPENAQIFGTTWFPRGPTSYLLAPKPAACRGTVASADDGENMTATSVSDRSGSVTMTIRAGGAGPSTDLACPYIPDVLAADKVFRHGHVFCSHPLAEVIRQIPTRTAAFNAAAVLVPARVSDPNIQGSGDGPGPTVALYTAEVSHGAANGQMIACTLAPGQADICAASLTFFLATQAQISARIGAANLNGMEVALSSFLAGHNI